MTKRFKKKSNNKINYIKVAFIGTIIATFFWFSFFSKRISPKIISLATIESDKRFYNVANTIINKEVKNINPQEFLFFTKNKNNEILLTEYNLKKVYTFLEKVNKYLKMDDEYVFFLESGMLSKNFLMNFIGFKIPIVSKIANNMFANVKTKITNYGINNALVELYIVIDVNQMIISPFSKINNNKKYEILIATYFINGKVPNFYGNDYVVYSNIFDIKEKI